MSAPQPISVEVRVDDLAFFEGDAILRPVTASLGATTSLLRRLEEAAGPGLATQVRLSEPLAVGSAIVSGAGALPVDFLVHAVVTSDSEPVSSTTVRRALLSALERAEGWGLNAVGAPPFGLGAGNLSVEESARAMAGALAHHARRPARGPSRVTLIAESEEEAGVFRWAFKQEGFE